MQKVTIWHHPRCSKSRETLALLQQRDIEPLVVEYLKNPPSITEITRALAQLGLDARGLMRSNEARYAQLDANDPALTQAQLIEMMHRHPELIQRPVVFANGRACIGRPPEAVLEIL